MAKGKASGYHLTNNDVSIVLGQVIRGDRDHDIAAWFGVNQGRIAEVKDGSLRQRKRSYGIAGSEGTIDDPGEDVGQVSERISTIIRRESH